LAQPQHFWCPPGCWLLFWRLFSPQHFCRPMWFLTLRRRTSSANFARPEFAEASCTSSGLSCIEAQVLRVYKLFCPTEGTALRATHVEVRTH
jgi:hypothetical protein